MNDQSNNRPVAACSACLILLAAALAAGCASPSKVTRASIEIQCGTNRVQVMQPKDTIIDRMEFDPRTGRLVLYGYQSTANAGAIEASKAQAAAQAAVWQAGFSTLQSIADKAAAAQGIPRGYRLVPEDASPNEQPQTNSEPVVP